MRIAAVEIDGAAALVTVEMGTASTTHLMQRPVALADLAGKTRAEARAAILAVFAAELRPARPATPPALLALVGEELEP